MSITLKETYGMYINGEFVPAVSGKTFDSINPATGEKLASIASGDKSDVDKAVTAAWKAFEAWGKTTTRERSEILWTISNIIEENVEYLSEIETMDNGKTIEESRWDIYDAVDEFRYFASCIRTDEGLYVEHNNDAFSIIRREPLGAVGQIVPWNYPICMGCWKLAPALAAGNCIVFKPASNTSISILELAKLLNDVLPAGVLNIVTGSGRVLGNALSEHKGINKIAFTGSTEVGRSIGAKAGQNIIPSTLELGGKSAHIVFPDCQWERALRSVQSNILLNCGQICCAGSRLFVHEDIYDKFMAELAKNFDAVKVGNGLDPEARMGPVIDEMQMNKILDYIDIGIKEGVRIAAGGKRLSGPEYDNGFFIAPTILADVDNKMRVAQEEIFGPVLVAIKFTDEADVIAMANDSCYGLAGGVWSQDINRAMRVAKALQAGTIWVNEFGITPTGSPFGGYKDSGYGREVHKQVLEHYTQCKNILVNTAEEPWSYYES